MESQNNKSYQTLAALIHISTFSKYIIPLGNFIFPLIIWTTGKKDRLIDHHGKQALNFQLSIFFYMVLVAGCALAGILITGINSGIGNYSIPEDIIRLTTVSAAFPLLTVLTIASVLLAGLFILELACVIVATVKAGEGKYYQYPVTIKFISSSEEEPEVTATTVTS